MLGDWIFKDRINDLEKNMKELEIEHLKTLESLLTMCKMYNDIMTNLEQRIELIEAKHK